MPDPRYSIGPVAPDLTPGINLLLETIDRNRKNRLAQENADTQRKFAERNLAISSANQKRQENQDRIATEELTRKHDIERSQQLGPLGAIARRQSPEMANEMGRPYGIEFSQGPAPQLPPMGEPAPPTMVPEEPSQGYVDAVPGGEAAPQLQTEQPMLGPEAPTPEETEYDRVASLKRPLLATIAGRSFALPEQTTDSALGPEYENVYDYFMAQPGMNPAKASQMALGYIQKNTAEQGRNDRATGQLEHRDTSREDQQAFISELAAKYRLTFDQRKQLAEIVNRGKMAAAGATTDPAIVQVLQSVEAGAPLSETAGIAAEHHIPSKAYAPLAGAVVRNAAAGERAGMKREALTATDDTGNVIGTWKDANSAKTGAQQIERFHRVKERLAELIHDVESQGSRVLTPDAVQQRLSKAAGVVAALRPFNELSNTAAGQKAEELIAGAMGAPGHGFLLGANADILKRLLTEAEGQHTAQLGTKLRPGGGSQLSPALGGKRQGGSSGNVSAARKWLADNPTADPKLRAKVEAKIQAMEGGGG